MFGLILSMHLKWNKQCPIFKPRATEYAAPEFVHLCNCFILPGNATWGPVSFPESSCCHLLLECTEFAPTCKEYLPF